MTEDRAFAQGLLLGCLIGVLALPFVLMVLGVHAP